MTEKKDKEFTVLRSSIGTGFVFKGKQIILNNGLPQSTLKALHALEIKAIVKKSK